MNSLARLAEADDALAKSGAVPFHLPLGSLDVVVAGALQGLERRDWWVPGLRERVGGVLRGVGADRLGGLDGARPYRVAPVMPSPALRALVAVGLAVSDPERAVLVHLGEGSLSDGATYEALNLAVLQDARVIFLLARLPLDGAPVPRQAAVGPARLAEAFGMPHFEVTAEVDAIASAVGKARQLDGPSLVVVSLGSATRSNR